MATAWVFAVKVCGFSLDKNENGLRRQLGTYQDGGTLPVGVDFPPTQCFPSPPQRSVFAIVTFDYAYFVPSRATKVLSVSSFGQNSSQFFPCLTMASETATVCEKYSVARCGFHSASTAFFVLFLSFQSLNRCFSSNVPPALPSQLNEAFVLVRPPPTNTLSLSLLDLGSTPQERLEVEKHVWEEIWNVTNKENTAGGDATRHPSTLDHPSAKKRVLAVLFCPLECDDDGTCSPKAGRQKKRTRHTHISDF
jgi:hypothetical protein